MREARRLDEIAALVNGVLAGDGSVVVTGVAGLREAGPGDLTFVAASRSLPDLERTRASAAIVPLEVEAFSIPVIRVENPHFALAKVLGVMYDRPRGPGFVSGQAVLGHGVRLGRDAQIHPHVFVGDGTEIGDRAVLYPGGLRRRALLRWERRDPLPERDPPGRRLGRGARDHSCGRGARGGRLRFRGRGRAASQDSSGRPCRDRG